jgi:hypothetical protein
MRYLNDWHSDNCDLQIAQINLSQALSALAMQAAKTTASMLGRPCGFGRRVKTAFGLPL